MHLSKIASRRITEPMEAWDDDTQQFIPDAFMGRIDLSDRFLSNFNKPLRRRMMFSEPGTTLPASRTIRHPGTKDVYLLGQTRGDAIGGNHYLNLTVLHLVTDTPNMSSGLATIYRKAPEGPADDPGWLVERELGKAFIDLEFRTSANEPDMLDTKVENYFCFAAAKWIFQPWDFLELHGHRYRVVDTFADSGLAGTRVDLEPDTRADFVIHTEGERVYDRTTHTWVVSQTAHNVTGVIPNYNAFSHWTSEAETYIDVVVEVAHIGFRPVAGVTTVELEGLRRVVTHVSSQAGERQYRLRCK